MPGKYGSKVDSGMGRVKFGLNFDVIFDLFEPVLFLKRNSSCSKRFFYKSLDLYLDLEYRRSETYWRPLHLRKIDH